MNNKEQEQKIQHLLGQMTLKEKVMLCHANAKFSVAALPRFGIEELTLSDGPHGVREEMLRDVWGVAGREDDYATYLPTGTALAATFSPELAGRHGETLGAEARWRGKDIILGPGVNIIRTPLCGRNFEYYSEDPYLTGVLAKNAVRGIQSQGTAACLKHFALNNQELDRNRVDVDIDDTSLHEIYLEGFRRAIQEGGALVVMGAYNRFRGQYCCHNYELVQEILKDDWGFDGVFLSDWAGVHDTDEAIENGLDLEMGTSRPYDEFYLARPFAERAARDPAVMAALDDKVRRILRLMLRIGKLDGQRPTGAFNTREHQQNAYAIAAQGMVLLKNDGLLPFSPERTGSILVVGPNADKRHGHGGNSSGVKALYEITPLEGLRSRFGGTCRIIYMDNSPKDAQAIPVERLAILDEHAGCRGFKMETFLGDSADGEPLEVAFCDVPGLHWSQEASHCGHKPAELFVRFTAVLPIEGDGVYAFEVEATSGVRFFLNGECRLNFAGRAEKTTERVETVCRAGEELELCLTFRPTDEDNFIKMLWVDGSCKEEPVYEEAEILGAARRADMVIYCGGLEHNSEMEGKDRTDITLPAQQDHMIEALLSVNACTVICLTAGSPVAMPWINRAKAVVFTWYAGMEGGNALADVLCGAVNPSGKLPMTFPARLQDCPAHRLGEYRKTHCDYRDGMMVGYRGFEALGIRPLFAFGHGLSYTAFAYAALKIEEGNDAFRLRFTLENTGGRTGREAAQLYVRMPGRPFRELKGIVKPEIGPGEVQECCFVLPRRELRIYDEKVHAWRPVAGTVEIGIGSASDDIRLTGRITLP